MKKMFLWLDDMRPLPEEYQRSSYEMIWHSRSVRDAKEKIQAAELSGCTDFLLDLDHDLGDYAEDGGDGIKLILWMIETGRNDHHYQVRLHTMNPVGRMNMRALIERYWKDESAF